MGMEDYPDGNYLPANYLTIRFSMQCPVCQESAQAETLIRENESRYLCAVTHDQFGPHGTCVFRFIAKRALICAISGVAVRQLHLFPVDAEGTEHAHPFAIWTDPIYDGHGPRFPLY